ncbi:unnamed protein product [Phytophthora lilii]|uniref:Unnamed protein product n=1 Tax=Phytophthora lilii TaxID=2077276 RepID=A0A9W6WZC9_9STRA|nr:unnamed protein product [Phytophthora lilii]
MTDASSIYQRFVEAPLRLKARTPSPSPPSTPPPAFHQYDASNPGPWGDSPAFSTRSKEVKKLRRRVAKITIAEPNSEAQKEIDGGILAAEALNTESSVGANSADAATSGSQNKQPETGSKSLLTKKKRVTRSVTMKNKDTGEEFVDTPTKASKPPKRFRKFSRDLSNKETTDGKENCSVFSFSLDGAESDEEKVKDVSSDSKAPSKSRRRKSVTVNLPLRRSRRLQHIRAESPKLAPASQQAKPVRNSPSTDEVAPEGSVPVGVGPDSAAEPAQLSTAEKPVDWISPLCDSLLSTNTISGCFFALCLNGLRDMQHPLSENFTASQSNPFGSVFTICIGIAECEKIAQRSFPSKSPKPKSPKSPKPPKSEVAGLRRRSSAKILTQTKKMKKSVRFRSFDLSCLNLQYVEDEQVAVMVDKILTRYSAIMEHVEKLVSQFDAEKDTPAQSMLRELSRVMATPSKIYSGILSNTDAETSKKIYRRAFSGRDSCSQHEIRICGEYFAKQFANLMAPPSLSSPYKFLQGVFSSLASSSVRFKLRVLFLESEDFGEDVSGGDVIKGRVLLDEDGTPFPAMAPYEHQDLGAAIHWALQESYLYWSLAKPLYDMMKNTENCISTDEGLDEASSVKGFLTKSAAGDLDHMEKYVLARRFLRFHVTKSWRHRLEGEGDTAKMWISIEKVCTLAKRYTEVIV